MAPLHRKVCSSHCFVCCKKFEVEMTSENYKKQNQVCEQFCVLVSRYFNLNNLNSDLNCHQSHSDIIIPEKTMKMFKIGTRNKNRKKKLNSCESCLPLLESICTVYKGWNHLQLRLNRSFQLIAKLMQDVSVTDGADDKYKEVLDFREKFINEALDKRSTKDFPHLLLKRLSKDYLQLCRKNENNLNYSPVAEELPSSSTPNVASDSDIKLEPEPILKQVKVKVYEGSLAEDSDSGSLDVWQPSDRENDDDEDGEGEANHNDDKKIDRDVESNNPKDSSRANKSIPSGNEISKKLKPKPKCHKCKICGKMFSHNYRLVEHMNTHTNSKPLKCRFCPRGFNTDRTRRYHEIKCDNKPKVRCLFLYKCGLCDKTFSHYPTCYSHQKVDHQGQKPCVIKLDKVENKNPDLRMDVAGSKYNNVADDLNEPEETGKVPIHHSSKQMLLEDNNATYNATSLKSPDEGSDRAEDSESGSADVCDHDNDDDDDDGGKIDRDVESNNPKNSSKANQNIPRDNETSKVLKPKSKCHKCELCGKVFPRNTELVEHTKSHSNFEVYLDQFKTQLGETAQSSNSIPVSVNPKRCLITYKCYQCDDTIFSSWRLLREHVKKVHGGRRLFPCKLCDQTFSGPEMLRSHNQRRHPTERGPFPCQFCGKTFLLKYNLKNHEVRNCKSNPARSNPPGGLVFLDQFKTKLEEKAQTQSSNSIPLSPKICLKKYKCYQCDDTIFSSWRLLREHVQKAHDGKRIFPCKLCGRIYSKLTGLNSHNEHKHSTERGPFPCQFCGKPFPMKFYVRTHELHNCKSNPARFNPPGGLQRFVCEICGKVYNLKSSLWSHKRTVHLNSNPNSNPNDTTDTFPCQFCGRQYTLRHKLEYHEKMLCKLSPANSAQLVCEKCGKHLRNKCALYKHMYNHRLEKGPGFPCSVCGKTFKKSDHRNNHERFHKEPAYACGYCGEKFIWNSSCRHHIKSRHKGQALVGHVVNLLTTSLPVSVVPTVTKTPPVETPPVLATENNTESAN